ncbi:MAG: hypothetical protein IPL47_09355 [Phyllobacteriaceae bacterium]|nr:hypothetical protein [Phyllobacteriaceae bacterium]
MVNGDCVCPKGTTVINGACRKPQQPTCDIKGQIVVNGNCVCPKGTGPINGACRNPIIEIVPKVLEQLQRQPRQEQQTPVPRKLIIQ